MRLIKRLLVLLLLLAVFVICFLFVVYNPANASLNLLIADWQLQMTLGGLVLSALVIGVLLGWAAHWLGSRLLGGSGNA